MAYTTINKSTDYFNTKLYTGNGSTNAITGVGHQPDLVWLKERSSAGAGLLFDAVRTATKFVRSSDNPAEVTAADTLTAFNSDGFTLGADASNYAANQNSETYASWNWKAGTGQGSSNTDGSINTTYTSVNTTAGFSISKFTGTGSNATIGHGLGVKPNLILFKRLDSNGSWVVYHSSLGATKYLVLNSSAAEATASDEFQNTEPTNSLISIGTDGGVNGTTMVAYAFAEKTGYSKFGSYVGNGNADGTFIYTGFKPAFVLFKGSTIAENWWMFDTKRSESNVANDGLIASTSDSEYSNNATFKIDILSNGFKMRSTDSFANSSGNTYIYMAFAEAPLVGSNNVPCTAR